jgi:hypothetical protein
MAKIYKSLPSTIERLSEYITEELGSTGFKHEFNIEANLLNYQFIRMVDNVIIYNITMSLEDITSNVNYASQSFVTPKSSAINYSQGNPEEITLTAQDFIFNLNNTITNKNNKITDAINNSETYFCPFKIFIPSIVGDFTTFQYQVLNAGDTIEVEVNAPNTVEIEPRTWKDFFSEITVSTDQATVNVGQNINVTVESSDTTLDMVYLEPIFGIVDRTRVKLVDGVGTFNILTDTMQIGDVVEVKVNFKTYTGVARFTKVIS